MLVVDDLLRSLEQQEAHQKAKRELIKQHLNSKEKVTVRILRLERKERKLRSEKEKTLLQLLFELKDEMGK